MHTRNYLNSTLITLLLILLAPVFPAKAQAGTSADLIAEVNAFRNTNGREPYSIDGELMALAQGQSEYQASIKTCTHQRENGSGPEAYGISAENIACGNNLSVQGAIYGQWTDQLHMATMLSPTSGMVGAGVAVVDGIVYYTLAVIRLSGDFNSIPQPKNSESQNNSQSIVNPSLNQMVTSTPNPDGSIAHIVQYGDTLINIANAYGITLDDLIAINNLSPTDPQIFEKQVLLIRVAFTETPFMTSTYTARPPTRTPLPTRTPRPTRTPTREYTPAPTRTHTPEPLVKIPSIEDLGASRPILAYTFIGIGALGLVLVILTAFLPRKK